MLTIGTGTGKLDKKRGSGFLKRIRNPRMLTIGTIKLDQKRGSGVLMGEDPESGNFYLRYRKNLFRNADPDS